MHLKQAEAGVKLWKSHIESFSTTYRKFVYKRRVKESKGVVFTLKITLLLL
jgi:hypothetical protein